MPSDTKKRTGGIYQLVNMITNEKYIGSTFQTLYKRQFDWRLNYNNWLKGKTSNSDTHKLFDNIHEYRWECFRIELLSEVKVNNKAELHKIEGDWIRKLDTFNNGLNGQIPNRDKKEYNKQYQLDNKGKIVNYKKQYYKNNKDKFDERHKQYYQKNKDKIVKQCKQYRQNNKNKIAKYKKQYQKNNSQKYNCTICNYSTYHKSNYISHLNTQKHKLAVMY